MRQFLLGFLLLMIPAEVVAEDRVAFIVGNSVYDYAPPLPKPQERLV